MSAQGNNKPSYSAPPAAAIKDPHAHSMYSWQANAEFWDESVGQEGNKYWQVLQLPALERMIPHAGPDGRKLRALELAAGNGLVSRWLTSRGDKSLVVTTEGSERLLQHAQRRNAGSGNGATLDFRQVDVTSEKDLSGLISDYGAGQTDNDEAGFDIIIINMAIQDISDLEPMARALPKLLKKDGVFVATLLHPVFWTSGAHRSFQIIEEDEHMEEDRTIVRSKVVTKYLHVPPWRGVAMYGQPVQQYYFHRPLHELFAIFFRAGLAMDMLEEPAFTEKDGNPDMIESHTNFTQLPAILAFRMRRLA